MGLRELGRVLHMTHNGYIVVKLAERDRLPKLNTPVYTRDARRIGVLLDIIGPVNEPYGVIKPDTAGVKVNSGTILYYRPPRPSRRHRRASGGRHRRRGRKP